MKHLQLFFIIAVLASCNEEKTTINFRCPCDKIGLDSSWTDSSKVSCYLIPVNKKSEDSEKGKYFLAVAVAASSNKTDENPLLYLHGGPGIATLENLPRYLKSKTWKLLRENHSLVFFDYRGTGFSQPVLCKDLQDTLQIISRTKPPLSERIAQTVSLYKNCREQIEKDDIDISSFSTFQLASDAEEIRNALQIKDWNVYGVSYGTWVGLTMLRNFPQHVKSMILDSPFPPNTPWVDYVRSFDTCFKVLENNIAKDSLTSGKFNSLRKDFVKAVVRLNNMPVPLPLKMKLDSTLSVYNFDGGDFAWSIWNAMLSPGSIPLVPLAIKEIASGNDAILVQWALEFNDPNKFGKFSAAQSQAISCYEDMPRLPPGIENILFQKYPEFSALIIPGINEAICSVWQPQMADKKNFEPVVSNIPVLIFAGEYDPVCPPLFGAVTAQTLPNSTFISVPSASHAAMHTDDCVRKVAMNFFLHPERKPEITCIAKRPKIKFITSDLLTGLKNLK